MNKQLTKGDSVDLYVIVYEVLDGECEWTFIVADEMDNRRAEIHALQHYKDCFSFEEDEGESISIDDTLGSVWYERVYAPGYKIELVKE